MKRIEQASGLAMIGTIALGMMAASASCLRVNDEHCMFNGGDDACTGAYCVAAVEGGSSALAAVRVDGCIDDLPPAGDMGVAYVQYGLVKNQTELDQLLERLGVELDCPEMPDMTPLLDAVKPDLDSRKKPRRVPAALTSDQRQGIIDFNDAIKLGMDECSEDQTTGSTTVVDETMTTGETEGATSSTSGTEPCTSDEMCPGERPFCNLDSEECVPCDGMPDPNAACAGLELGTPVCLDGCVQCTAEAPDACTGVPPLCDAQTNTCQPCTAHGQCGEAACNLFTGACLPEDAVVHVGPGQDLATLALAVNSFGDGAEGTIVVHAGAYNESVTVEGGRVRAFLAAGIGVGINPPVWTRSSGATPQLTVNADSTVLMDGMQLSGNVSTMVPGLLVDGGRAWVDRSRIIINSGSGIVAQAGAELRLRNCFVGDGNLNDYNALEVNGATANVLYTTLATGFLATALTCDAIATVEVRNSLLVTRDATPEVTCRGATIEQSAAESDLGPTNVALGDMSTTWFANYNGGDLHLDTEPAMGVYPPAIGTAAQRRADDPPTDIDGEARPAEGSSDHAGADVP
jgi:hypothetical protein